MQWSSKCYFDKINDGKIIGEYTTIPLKCESNSYISDKDAFIFSIDSKEKYSIKSQLKGENAVYHDQSNYCCCYGFCGDDLAIYEKFLNNSNSYCSGNGDYCSFETNNLKMIGKGIKGKVYFITSELEVYKVCSNETEFHKDLSTFKDETVKISHVLTDN